VSDLKQRILEIIRKPHLACFATVTEDGKPWVRYVSAVGNEDLTVKFSTFVNSRKVLQIKDNPEVHLTCGCTSLESSDCYLQIQGTATFTTDYHERHSFWNEHLKGYFSGPDDPNYGILVVTPYRVELWGAGPEPLVWESPAG